MSPKARAAINVYVMLQTADNRTIDRVIEATLKAERMHRDTLYDWCTNHGYRWRPARKQWVLLGALK